MCSGSDGVVGCYRKVCLKMLTGMYGLFGGVWAKQGGWHTLGVRVVVYQCA